MAAKKAAEQTAHQGQAIVEALRENPYVQRVLADQDLREQAREAYDSAQSAYKRASKAKRPVKALAEDAKLQRDLKAAFFAAQAVQAALGDAPKHPTASSKKRRGGGLGKTLLIAVVGAGIALAASSGLRDKVLDLLFGPEETFDYVPTANGNGTHATTPEKESAAS